MHADEFQRVVHSLVEMAESDGRLATDEAAHAERTRFGLAGLGRHHQVKHLGRFRPGSDPVQVDAGDGDGRVFADVFVVVDADDGELVGNRNLAVRTCRYDLLRENVVGCEETAGTGKRA